MIGYIGKTGGFMRTGNKFMLGILICIFVILPLLAVIFKDYLHPFPLMEAHDTGTAMIMKKTVYVPQKLKASKPKK
jgi:hypothetical protein